MNKHNSRTNTAISILETSIQETLTDRPGINETLLFHQVIHNVGSAAEPVHLAHYRQARDNVEPHIEYKDMRVHPTHPLLHPDAQVRTEKRLYWK